MVANAVSDSNAISTPYDNDNVDGSDYPYLADIFYTLVSEDVFNRILAYYTFMTTDLIAAYHELADNYMSTLILPVSVITRISLVNPPDPMIYCVIW